MGLHRAYDAGGNCLSAFVAECEMARMLGKRMPDLEDNLIIASGETADVDYVVTSDRRMLEAMPEVCLTPARALEMIGILG